MNDGKPPFREPDLDGLVADDRMVGGLTPACAEQARAPYACFVEGALIVTDCRTAELVKLAENAFRDVNIAFANELAALCERLGVDVWQAIALANHQPRVAILRPGAGVGGHCIPLDPWFLIAAAPDQARLLATARAAVVAFLVPHRAFRGIDRRRLAEQRVVDPAGVLAEG
ncbi:nucleotide sugar dehydrogenase [Elioraea thermophila]|uniref:hypothetical protein n=1 Tax=Elioraea thermophila TaxID=2185104 RepID=UPI0018E5224B|nr:hypothetical protein [Elioraea thermophila]